MIFLAVVTCGIAVYTIINTYPGMASDINTRPSGYEGNPSSVASDNTILPGDVDDHVDVWHVTPPDGFEDDVVPEAPPPRAGEPGFILLTEVDNSLLPWYLKLVNRYNFLDYDFMPQLMPIGNGHYFDARAGEALLQMIASANSEGLSPIVVSSFRSVARQTVLFNNRVQRFVDQGYDYDTAWEYARRIVAYPGTSEHNLGLAVDIVANSYHGLTARQATTAEGIWLAANSYRYGFVLRYPDHKQDITNIIFEPWHFRYVGIDAAREMFERDLVLEEFVSELLAQ